MSGEDLWDMGWKDQGAKSESDTSLQDPKGFQSMLTQPSENSMKQHWAVLEINISTTSWYWIYLFPYFFFIDMKVIHFSSFS